MNNTDLSGIVNQAKEYITSYFHSHKQREFIYHNIDHTHRVIEFAEKIGRHYQLNETDFFILQIAAIFHDSGYFTNSKDHEREGARLAEQYLQPRGIDESVITAVKKTIMATVMPQKPEILIEQILCDADLYHLGTTDFPDLNKLMRKEYEQIHGEKISKDDWRQKTIGLFNSHHYQTAYAKQLLDAGKDENLKDLIQKQKENDKPTNEKAEFPDLNSDLKHGADRPSRGIETMFRISSGNHQRLSDMADNKAHIMITVNAIILSAVISILLRKLDSYYYLAYPTYLILMISLGAMIFAVLATRPSIPSGTFTQKDIEEKKVNLLFFGNFYRMNLDEYAAGMEKVMNDREFLYGTLIKDLYFQGITLGKKYRLLRISYNIFMYGLIVSIFAFVIVSLVYSSEQVTDFFN
ncbi:HD domain-containing protein [Pedobacter sp. HMF7647]|uniref:HD domain-containing protein n=1 Tax=Hufsiella arboris TaxID=2695275 RepID=A0A7K1Y7Q8_9SPHI|nr:Pycsar system effector family protein [Hufsiella arboris]MXV50624.1 HD domain-containing protein [Hufsiella arboris]